MDKRYQVFVSSTFADLKEERSRVIQTLMEMDCIPAGMELFPAADEEQLSFIKRVIDDCDYYVVIVGGRYGSMTSDGVSYTEREYDYALERGLKVIALLHETPDSIPLAKSDGDPAARERLQKFRDRLAAGRLVKFWSKADDLPGLVALSLAKTINMYPAQGWIRAGHESQEELLEKIASLRRENEKLTNKLRNIRTSTAPIVRNLAGLDVEIQVYGTCEVEDHIENWSVTTTWRELFALISPFLLTGYSEYGIARQLEFAYFTRSGRSGRFAQINPQVPQTIKVQLLALQLIDVAGKSQDSSWTLTPNGRSLMFETRTIRMDGGEGS